MLETVIQGLITLGGVGLGYCFGVRRLREEKHLEFVERQLREFYSPMVGMVRRIRGLSELRLELSEASDEVWREKARKAPKPWLQGHEAFTPFRKAIKYNNRQFGEEILPAYEEMEALFSEKIWLASPETSEWYQPLLRYVDLWRRWLDDSLPSEVAQEVGHSDEELQPFYEHLESKLQQLQDELEGS